jgi:hypothetical protein
MIDLTKAVTVFIGRRGEHNYRNIEFDVSSLLEDNYPSASLNAIYKRPDGVAYPVVTNYADGVLTWSPSATDTLLVGVGQLEIRVTYSDVVGKSVRILTIIEEVIADGIAEPPEPPAQEWLNQVLSALTELDGCTQAVPMLEEILSNIGSATDYWSFHKTILGYANSAFQHTHSRALCYPTLANGIQMNSGTTSWALGAFTEIIPAGAITSAYDAHWINFETASASGVYEIHLFAGAPGEETLVAQTRTVRDNNQYGISSVPIQMPIQPPNTRLSGRLASNNSSRDVTLSVYYHKYEI